jgi:hypothetical protein
MNDLRARILNTIKLYAEHHKEWRKDYCEYYGEEYMDGPFVPYSLRKEYVDGMTLLTPYSLAKVHMKLPVSTVNYHIKKLCESGDIKLHKTGGYSRYPYERKRIQYCGLT